MFGFLKKWLGGMSGPASLSPLDAQVLATSGAIILDVRSAAERRAAYIPGSTHLPLDELNARLAQLPRQKTIICQCASGRRSALATRLLTTAGLDARNLRGGITAWQGAGPPTKSK